MIEANNVLYPINNIKEIRINREGLYIAIYFLNKAMYPVTIQFEKIEDLEEKVNEYTNKENKKKRILHG